MYGKHFEDMYVGSMRGTGAITFAVWGYIISHQKPPDFDLELNPDIIGFLLGEESKDVAAVLEKFCEPDPKSRHQEEEGRRLIKRGGYMFHVVNGKYYNDIRTAEERRAYWRDYKKKSRDSGAVGAQEAKPAENGKKAKSGGLTLEKVKEYAQKIGLAEVEAELFFNHYESNGWMDKGGNPIRSWEATLKAWAIRESAKPAGQRAVGPTKKLWDEAQAEQDRIAALPPSTEPPPQEDFMKRFAPAQDDGERAGNSHLTKGQLKANERTEYENMLNRDR